MQIEVVGFKDPKDPNFSEAWKACTKLVTLDRTKWLDLIIQDGMCKHPKIDKDLK